MMVHIVIMEKKTNINLEACMKRKKNLEAPHPRKVNKCFIQLDLTSFIFLRVFLAKGRFASFIFLRVFLAEERFDVFLHALYYVAFSSFNNVLFQN